MPTILEAALRSRLVHQLQKALCTEKIFSDVTLLNDSIAASKNCKTLPPNQPPNQPLIPLKLIKQSDRQQLEYVSAVALKYAQPAQRSPVQLAENLMETFSKIEELSNADASSRKTLPNNTALNTISNPVPVHFKLEVTPLGLIYFRLALPDLAVWLQTLIDRPLIDRSLTDCTCPDDSINGSVPVSRDTAVSSVVPATESRFLVQTSASARNSTSVFSILHTYARCHSVLRLGQQAGLIEATQNGFFSEAVGSDADWQWQIQAPHPLPWLLPIGAFRGRDSSEWQLVEQICAVLDAVASQDPDRVIAADSSPPALLDEPELLRQADRLSQSWQTFYAQCRIVGEVLRTDPAQAQMRLGLTCITQKLLHVLLRSIGLPTPAAL